MKNGTEALGKVPPHTHESERDAKYGTDMGRWFLAVIGVWPLSKKSHIIKKIVSEIWIVTCYFLITFMFVPACLNTIFVQKDPAKQIRTIGTLTFSLAALAKYNFMIGHKNEINECIRDMNIDYRRIKCDDDRKYMLQYAKTGRIIATCSTIMMYSAGLVYRLILPLTRSVIVTPNNVTIRPLATPIYDPLFSAHTYKSWVIVFIVQTVSGYVIYTTAVGACNLASILVLHACGQLKLIMTRLEDCVEGNKHLPDKVEDRVAEIIQLHVRSLCFVFRVEHIMNKINFAEVGASTLIICIVGFDLILAVRKYESPVSVLSFGVHVVSFTTNIFIFCYIGETLSQQERKVGVVAYLIDWHKLPVTNAKDIMLMIAMSRYPANITAGKMMELSFTTFCSIMRTSVAYLNVLRATTD